LSSFLLTFLATRGKPVVGAGLSGKIVGIAQHNFFARRALLKLLFKEDVGDYFFVVRGSLINLGNNSLSKDC
jgi:hypothetical protein